MVERIFNINHHCWNGRGGPRGLVTHVWDRTFLSIKQEIEKGGIGKYKITFERIDDVAGERPGDGDATC